MFKLGPAFIGKLITATVYFSHSGLRFSKKA